MLIALSAKNKLKLVNGDYEEPDSSSDLRAYWERANDMLISWTLNTVSEQIGNNLTFVNSASDLWKELSEHYSQLDGHRIYQLANEIDELDAIEAPYACTCKCICVNGKENGEREHRKRLIQFLMGQEEKQRETQKQHINTLIALNTYRNSHSSSYNSSQRNTNPINPIQPNTQTDKRNTFRKGVFCGYCKKEGYSKEECFKMLGYPVGHPLHKKYLPPS
ncbi:hypothetical protein Tco_0034100 [Tanacetum coccineum]